MALLQQIKKQLTNISNKEVVKKMGYSNIEVGIKTLQSLLDEQDIYTWLKDSHYDFRYTSKEFIKKLCHTLEISDIDYVLLLDTYAQRIKNINLEESSYVYINTNFKRKGEPVFALALMEGRRRINIDKELLFDMNLTQAITYASEIVKTHYKENKGTLPLWGTIQNYIFNYKNQEKVSIDINGYLTKDGCKCPESLATVTIKNKILF